MKFSIYFGQSVVTHLEELKVSPSWDWISEIWKTEFFVKFSAIFRFNFDEKLTFKESELLTICSTISKSKLIVGLRRHESIPTRVVRTPAKFIIPGRHGFPLSSSAVDRSKRRLGHQSPEKLSPRLSGVSRQFREADERGSTKSFRKWEENAPPPPPLYIAIPLSRTTSLVFAL